MAHAKFFQPSSSERVVACPASWRLSFGRPNVVGIEAAQGTLAHEVHADTLTSPEHRAVRWLGHKSSIDGFEVSVDEEMVNAVQESANWVLATPGSLYVEQQVDISYYTPVVNQFGSLDAAVAKGRKLVVTDLKYGQGVRVDAERNTQLTLYALGFAGRHEWHGIRDIELRISQPRLGHFDVWEVSRSSLEEFGQHIASRFRSALLDESPEFNVGPHCRFCPARVDCPEQQRALDEVVSDVFDIVGLSTERVLRILELRPVVENWFKAVNLRAMELAHDDALPGWKLVEARAHRQWTAEADRELKDKPVWKLVTPAQAEKIIGKEVVAALSEKPPGKPTLAPESDKRPKYSVDLEFCDEDS